MARIDKIDREADLAFLLFHLAGDVDGMTRLQKLLFLIEKESEFNDIHEEISFDFESHHYGPFSELVYDEVRFLLSLGALETVEPDYEMENYETNHDDDLSGKRFRLTEKGEKICSQLGKILDDEVEKSMKDVVEEYSEMTNDDLLEYVYTQYPEYTDKSKIKDEVL